jgi:CRP-like cAMP-binding protein
MPERLDAADSMRAEISLKQNGLLASVSSEGRSHLGSAGTIVELRLDDILPRLGEKVEHVWFPLSGMVSLAVSFRDGNKVEVGLVGREGVVGLSSLLHGRDPVDEAVVQLPGLALRVKRSACQKLMENDHSTALAILRYSHDLFALVSQNAACNLRHALRQRLARLILQSDDRSDGGAMPLTQKSLATMLGVPRTSVSDAAQQLQAQGAIQYARGRLTVINRAILEQLSCECYEAVQARIGDGASMLHARAPQSARRAAPLSGNSRPLL